MTAKQLQVKMIHFGPSLPEVDHTNINND